MGILKVELMLKPKGVDLNTWLEECNKATVDDPMAAKPHEAVQLPNAMNALGLEGPLTVSARVTKEGIINQKIIVLDVQILNKNLHNLMTSLSLA
jgi:hypothetical protein